MASNLDDAKSLRADLMGPNNHFNTRTTEILESALDTYIAMLEAGELRIQDPMVRCIRAICAHELGADHNYDFFHTNYLPGEHPDDAILRLFKDERERQDTDFDAVLAMCHG